MTEHDAGAGEPIPTTREALAAHWNELGRAHFRDVSERLTRYYGSGQGLELDL